MHVEVSGQSFAFPPKCACCCAPADSELTVAASKSTGKKVVHTKTNAWDIPYCRHCINHVRALDSARRTSHWLAFFSLVLGSLTAYVANGYLGSSIGVLCLIGTVFARKQMVAQAREKCHSYCASVDRAIVYLGWHGSLHRFDISSNQFAAEFMGANERKLVNLSQQARQLLAATTPAAKPNASRTARRYFTSTPAPSSHTSCNSKQRTKIGKIGEENRGQTQSATAGKKQNQRRKDKQLATGRC